MKKREAIYYDCFSNRILIAEHGTFLLLDEPIDGIFTGIKLREEKYGCHIYCDKNDLKGFKGEIDFVGYL